MFDALTMLSLSSELNSKLQNGKITKIANVSGDTFVFTIRANSINHKLLISCNPTNPRMHLLNDIETTDALGFCMHLRKHITNATIVNIKLHELERIINIDLIAKDDFFVTTYFTLSIEIMGRHSNILLLKHKDDSFILNASVISNCALTNSLDSTRPLLSGLIYTPPPVQMDKISFLDKTKFAALLSSQDINGQTIQNILNKSLYGFSKATLSEILHIAALNPDDTNLTPKQQETLINAFSRFYTDTKNLLNFKPCIITLNDKTDFYIYPYNNLKADNIIRFESLSLAISACYQNNAKNLLYENNAKQLKNIVNTAYSKLSKKIESLQTKIQDAQNAEIYKQTGELIIANIYKIKKGDSIVTVQNYYSPDYEDISIKLDTLLTPALNAQRYYKKYNKAKKTAEVNTDLLSQAYIYLKFLDESLESLRMCTKTAELYEIGREIAASYPTMLPKSLQIKYGIIAMAKPKQSDNHGGQMPGKKSGKFSKQSQQNKTKQSTPTVTKLTLDGFTIYIGKNSTQNDYITHSLAKPDDLWLHAKNLSGSHVIIVSDGNNIPASILSQAASIAAYYSKGHTSTKVEVDYTLKKHVKKLKGGLGKVTYTHQKTLVAEPKEIQ